MFTAKYKSRTGDATYYRTIRADTINEAMKQAEQWARKGYMCLSVRKGAMVITD